MLVLSRKPNQMIHIGNDIVVRVSKIRGTRKGVSGDVGSRDQSDRSWALPNTATRLPFLSSMVSRVNPFPLAVANVSANRSCET